MTGPDIAHTAAAAGPFRSWAASYPGPAPLNRPDLGLWAIALPEGVVAALTSREGALTFVAGGAAAGFLMRDGALTELAADETRTVQTGDRCLLCTAALLAPLAESAVAAIVAADEDAPAERLVLAALAAAAVAGQPPGDVTVVTVQVVGDGRG